MTATRPTSITRLSPALEAACWWVSGVMLAPVLFRLLPAVLPPAAPVLIAPSADLISRPPIAGGAELLFGVSDQEGPPKVGDVRLLGWMESGRSGAVVISVRDGPQRILRKGEPSADGLLFQGIDDDAVVLVRGGRQTKIPLPRSNGLNTPDKRNVDR